MESRSRRPIDRRAWVCLVALILACQLVSSGTLVESETPTVDDGVYPVGEQLSYAVSWMGIHCGEMEITTFVDTDVPDAPIYRIVGLARTSKFFDGIYRLRSRVDSFFDPRRMTSVRFEQHSHEKKKRNDEVWLVDEEAKEVVRTKNGETKVVAIETDRAYDPLAFIARLRTIKTEVGEEIVLGVMTSDGVEEVVARAVKAKTINTKMGKIDAVAVIPQPGDGTELSKSGSMVVWIERDEPHRPCKIEFDLSFGSLVVSLKGVGVAPEGDVGAGWEHWGDSKRRDR